jgi:hypothetical protein
MINSHEKRDSKWSEDRRRRLPNPAPQQAYGWTPTVTQGGWRDASKTPGAIFDASGSTLRFILLCALWYTSSALSSNTGKAIMLIFKFPITLTIVQFAFVSGYCLLLGSPFIRLAKLRKPTPAILRSTIPVAAFQVGGHIFSSMAISRIPVSTVHTIKVGFCSFAPVGLVLNVPVLRRRYRLCSQWQPMLCYSESSTLPQRTSPCFH